MELGQLDNAPYPGYDNAPFSAAAAPAPSFPRVSVLQPGVGARSAEE